MKFCKDCRYCVRDIWCHSPNNGVSLVDGKAYPRFAILNRDSSGIQMPKCGPDAEWFAMIDQKKSFWKKIKEWWNA